MLIVVVPLAPAVAAITLSVPPSGSLSLLRTVTVTAWPLNVDAVSALATGGLFVTIVHVNATLAEPPNGSLTVSLTRYTPGTVGVPVIFPVDALIDRPVGSVPFAPTLSVYISGSRFGSAASVASVTAVPTRVVRLPGLL